MPTAPRIVVLALGVFVVFGVTVLVLLQVIPGPHKDRDSLVSGGAATLISMLAVFLVVITTVFRSSETFFKRRKRD